MFTVGLMFFPPNFFLDKATGKLYIMLETRLCALYKSEEEYEILERFKGDTLRGKKYLPLFPYYSQVSMSSK